MFTADMLKGCSISVNPQKWRGAGAAVLLALALAGCGTFSNYPMGMEQTTLTPLRTGQKTGYDKTFAKRTSGGSGALFAMEMGRTAQLEGDVAASRGAFEQAIAAAQADDDQAALSVKGAAAQTGAVLVNDKVIPYRASGFERTLVHHYQALNYLASNDVVGAGVEVRRANREQEAASQKHQSEIAKSKSKEQNVEPGGVEDPNLATVYAGLDQMAGAVKFSFQNAATFYVSSVVWEMLGERNDAYIDCKRALEIYPDNPFVQQDVVRLGKRLGMREDLEDFERRFPEAAQTPADGSEALARKARLVVVYEEGLVPKKTDLTLPYPLPSANSIGMISLPIYQEKSPPPVPAEVALGGKPLGKTAPICDVGALAARALGEQMPGILTRQLARAVAKGAAANAAERSGGDFAMFAVLMYNLVSEQADLRSWLTLPAHVQIFSAWVDPGCSAVAVSALPGGATWSGDVTFTAGKTTLLVVSRIDLAVYSQVIVQP
jgi:hypothetical protein